MVAAPSNTVIQSYIDALGECLESQFKLVQHSTDATLAQTFIAVARRNEDGILLTKGLLKMLDIDHKSTHTQADMLERIIEVADARNLETGLLKKYLPVAKETIAAIHERGMSVEDAIRNTRDFMNKNGL